MQDKSNKKSFERSGSVKKNIRFEDDLIDAIHKELPPNENPATKDKTPVLGFSEWVKSACWEKLKK